MSNPEHTQQASHLGPRTRRLITVGKYALLVMSLVALGLVTRPYWYWKRFDTVVAGKIYRSGQLQDFQLKAAMAKFGIKTVVCLNVNKAEAERVVCEAAGGKHRAIDLPDDGDGPAEEYAKVLAILTDPAQQPVLVHCQAGVARTGTSVALYRVFFEGWDVDRAINELKTYERWGRIDPTLDRRIRDIVATWSREKPAVLAERISAQVPARR